MKDYTHSWNFKLSLSTVNSLQEFVQ